MRFFGFVVGAAVAGEYDFLVWVHVHGAELACADAPSASVAGVFVYADYAAVASCFKASLGQAVTHAGSSQCLQVIARFTSGPMRMARIRDLVGLKVFSLTMLQAYSQTTAADAFVWVSCYEFSVLWAYHFSFLLVVATGA